MSCNKFCSTLVWMLAGLFVAAVVIVFMLRGELDRTRAEALKSAEASTRKIAEKDRSIASLQQRLTRMTKMYEEEYADRSAMTDYLAGIKRTMDFAKPFGFTLREKIDKARILPGGIYIREGDYEKFDVGEMLVDRDTMAFAKISGYLEPEEPFKDEKAVVAEFEKRMNEDLAKKPYPFPVSHRVWMEDGRLNFELLDVDMVKKMEKREQRSLQESLEGMKAYRESK